MPKITTKSKRMSLWEKMKRDSTEHLKNKKASMYSVTLETPETLSTLTPETFLYYCSCGNFHDSFFQLLIHQESCSYKDLSIKESPTFATRIKCNFGRCDKCCFTLPRTIECSGDCKQHLCFTCADIGREFNQIFNENTKWKCVLCKIDDTKKREYIQKYTKTEFPKFCQFNLLNSSDILINDCNNYLNKN